MDSCRVAIEERNHDARQTSFMADMELIRSERFDDDRKQVRATAALLIAKQKVTGKSTQWRGDVYLGSKDCTWTYANVVARAVEHPAFEEAAIDLSSLDLNTYLAAATQVGEMINQAALEVAFESLDVCDIWNDVDHLMTWEPEQ